MSTLTASGLRTVAFGDLDAGNWGAAWGAAEPFATVGSLQAGAVASGAPTSIDGSSPAEEWSLSGEGIELALSPESEPAMAAGRDGFDQLCRVRGRFVLGGAEYAVDALGRRGSHAVLEAHEFESIRDVSAWFEPDEGIALTALRPPGAAGQDRDIVIASVFEPKGVVHVSDPRLSTTYNRDGLPARASVELWLERDDEDEQFPRRAAGEALGAGSTSARGELELQAHPFRWHSRGQDGAGVYLLVQQR
jgi:hypothetical protein